MTTHLQTPLTHALARIRAMGEGQYPGSVIPAQAGIQRSRSAGTAPDPVAATTGCTPARVAYTVPLNKRSATPTAASWIPAFAGMTSGCSLDRHPRSVAAQAPTSVPTQATTPPAQAGIQRSRSAGTASGSVIPAQAGIQRSRSAGTAFGSVIPAQAGIQCGRSVSTGAPATAHAQDLALPRISRAPTSRARRTAYPHPSTTPAGHKETGVSLQ